MSRDLLAAIGARLEARLNTHAVRTKSLEETVKAHVAANPPAAFLMPERAKLSADVAATDGQTENNAPVAAWTHRDSEPEIASYADPLDLVTKAQTLANTVIGANDTAAEATAFALPADTFSMPVTQAAPQTLTPVIPEPVAEVAGQQKPPAEPAPVQLTVAQMIAAQMAPAHVSVTYGSVAPAPVAQASVSHGSSATASIAQTSQSQSVVAQASVAQASAAQSIAQFATPVPIKDLAADGTPIAYTPEVPANYGVGATIRRAGVWSDVPMTVTRLGSGVVFANFTDSEGTREMAFHPHQMDLVTAAP